jgi:hypothetical protein
MLRASTDTSSVRIILKKSSCSYTSSEIHLGSIERIPRLAFSNRSGAIVDASEKTYRKPVQCQHRRRTISCHDSTVHDCVADQLHLTCMNVRISQAGQAQDGVSNIKSRPSGENLPPSGRPIPRSLTKFAWR